MKRTVLVSCLLAAFLTHGPLGAQQSVPTISLSEALRLFANQNLELRLARSRALEAAGQLRQATAFPNPSLALSYEPLSGEAGSYSESYLNLSQRFELPGQRRARSEVAQGYRRKMLFTLQADSLGLAFEVKRAFFEAGYAGERVGVIERVTRVFREAASAASARYREGDVSLYDLKRIEAELTRYENLQGDAEISAASAQQALAILVAPEGAARRIAPDGMPTGIPPDMGWIDGLDLAKIGRAELDAAEAEVAVAEAQARLTRAERTPDLTATGGYKRQSDGLSGAFLGLSLPLPLFDRRSGALESADARVRIAEERLALTRRAIENDILLATDTYENLRRRVESLDNRTMEGSSDLLTIARVAYQAGEMELVELTDAAEALEQAQNAAARLRSRLWIAYYDLERALGGIEADGPSQASELDR